MSLSVSEPKLLKTQSGQGLRFSVTMSLDDAKEFSITTKGWIAFRNAKGDIEPKPPVSMINVFGKRKKYEGTLATQKLLDKVQQFLVDNYDDAITSDPDWNEIRKMKKLVIKHEGGFVL